MSLRNQAGYVSGAGMSLIITILLLLGAIGFGVWAFMERQDYKNNSDQKSAVAVAAAQKVTQEQDAVKYAEEAKNPLKTHKAPDQFGGVTVQYPKTWSGYVIEGNSNSLQVDDYFHPSVVPGVNNKNVVYALRVQVEEKAYDKVVDGYQSDVKNQKLSASAYSLPKLPDIVGTRLNGQIDTNKQGSMIILPMRNTTLKVWTESSEFLPDFENIILNNLSFSP